MAALVDFPDDLHAIAILHHFNTLASVAGPTEDYEIITLGIRAAKTTIKITMLLKEVVGWGEPTLTSWNMTTARKQEIIHMHDALDDLSLPSLHRRVAFMVTGGAPKSPPRIISLNENIITHTVLESLPLLAHLRVALAWWEGSLERSQERKQLDEERRLARPHTAVQPRLYREFHALVSSLGGGSKAHPLPAASAKLRPASAPSANDTPPATPPGSGISSRRLLSTLDPAGVKDTFHINDIKISWLPYAENHPRYHTNAYIVIHREKRRPKQLYVSLNVNGGEGKTAIWVRVGGGWREFEGWLRGFLGQQGGGKV